MSGGIQKDRSISNRDLRPRPLVRPTAPPLKVMPKQSAPPRPDRSHPLRKMASPVSVPPVNYGSGFGAVPASLIALNTTSAHADISAEVSSLQSSLSDLQSRSTFSDTLSDINDLDTLLNRVVELLESARQEGYRYQNDMEDIAYGAMSHWQTVRPQVTSTLQQQAAGIQSRLPSLNPQLQRLNTVLSNPASATSLLRSTQSQVNNLLQDVSRIESDLENNYSEIESQVQKLNTRLTNVHWAMDQLAGAKFGLQNGEDLVMGVPARWDKEGKDDPEGVLYLSNKRLIFERKEKVATKKILFITTASELVQEVQIDSLLANVKGIKAENKGLFGHQDFLLVDFADRKLGTVSHQRSGFERMDFVSGTRSFGPDRIRTFGRLWGYFDR